jgi:peptidoglycan/xylan/chitin deacetylase (PgdA/CDA1 family)
LQKAARLLSPALYYSQVHQLSKPIYSGMGQILMLHRVVPTSNALRIHNHESLEVSPEYLENLIQFFKKKNYQFLSLDELAHLKERANQKQKFVVFTFDDGYVDNLAFAYPIFKKHNIPFAIYVATNMPDGTAKLWWYLLEDLVVENAKVEFVWRSEKLSYLTDSIKNKEVAFNKIRSLFAQADEQTLNELLQTLFADNLDKISAKTKNVALTWDQIVQLSKDPLVTIGSHTVNHFPLHSLTRENSSFEILESKKILEARMGMEVRHFCYPLGSYGSKEIEILKETNYQTATTIKMANLFSENLNHPFSLPRIMINSLTTEHILTLQINGLLPAIRNKLSRVVT